MNINHIVSGIFVSLICLGFHLNAQNIPLDPAVRTGKLPNGFTYYIRHNNTPEKRAQLYLVNNVGSVLEDDDQQGLAHFMEHMNFNGTRHFPKNELVDYLQKAGIRFGADLNAHTGTDETVYQLPIATDHTSMLKKGLQIMLDWAQEATLDANEIEKERGVILEEARLKKGAGERMMRKYQPMLVNHSRFAQRLPIGIDSILINFKPEVIKRFYKDWYRPDLQALIVVGDVNVDQLEKDIKSVFSNLKVPVNKRKRTEYTIPLTGKNQFMAVTDREMSGITMEVIFKHKVSPLKTEQDYFKMMKWALINRMLISRRAAEISRQQNPAYINMNAAVQPFLGGLEMFVFEVNAKDGQLQTAFEQTWRYIEKLLRFGFSASEFEQAKDGYLKSFETAGIEKNKTPSVDFVTEYQKLYLNQQAAPGIDWESSFVKSNIDNITIKELNSMLKDYLKDKDRDILILAADKDKGNLPDEAKVTSWINAIKESNIKPFIEEKMAAELLPVRPNPGKVVSKKYISELDITELVLSNGVKVILKPTKFKNDEILFKGFSPGGTSLYNDADYDNASNAAILVGDFGVANFNPNQLNQILTNKVANVMTSIDSRAETIRGSSSKSDLETTLQLAYLRFTSPRKDTLLFKNILNNARAKYGERYANPSNVFTDSVNKIMGNYSYRFSPPDEQRYDHINLDKVYSIYKDRFSDASGFTFTFVGSFENEVIIPLIERYLGSLPSLYRNEKARDLGIHVPKGQLNKPIYKGTENKANVKLLFSGDYKLSIVNNLLLKALGDILQVKMTENLREVEGEVYSPSVQTVYNKYPKNRYAVVVDFGCDPKNVDHLINAVKKEMKSIVTVGVQGMDVQKFKAAYMKNVELALKDNGFWLNYITGQYENQENILEVLSSESNLAVVTPESLKKAAASFFSDENVIQFILLPENKG